MNSLQRVLDLLKRPENMRYLAIGIGATLIVSIAIVAGPNSPQEVKTGEAEEVQGQGPGDATNPQAGEPGAAPSPGATGAAGAKAGSTAAAGGGTKALPPITDTEVKVGMAYIQDPGAANAAAGFAGIGQVDQKRAYETMVKEVNKAAPGGRKIVPVYYSYTTADLQSKGADQLYQEMCSLWTKDNRVFMAWATGQDTLRSCMTKGKVAMVGSGLGFSYAKTFEDFPWYVEHNASALDRMAKDEVDNLFDRGYFAKCKPDPSTQPCVDGKPRIALIRYDQPSYKAAAATMKKALAAQGLGLCEGCEFEISYSASDVAAQLDDATEVNAAINTCRTPRKSPATGAPDGPCTHMLFLGSTAGVRITLFYVQRAEDQGYRARLGFNTLDAPMAVRNFFGGQGQTQYYNQFKQSILVSSRPADLGLQPDALKECKKLFTDAGETFGGSDDTANNKINQAPFYCDSAWYHIATFNSIGRSLSLETWLANGVANSGVVKSASTLLMRTTATRRDGAGAVRIGEWFDDCSCFKAVSDNILV